MIQVILLLLLMNVTFSYGDNNIRIITEDDILDSMLQKEVWENCVHKHSICGPLMSSLLLRSSPTTTTPNTTKNSSSTTKSVLESATPLSNKSLFEKQLLDRVVKSVDAIYSKNNNIYNHFCTVKSRLSSSENTIKNLDIFGIQSSQSLWYEVLNLEVALNNNNNEESINNTQLYMNLAKLISDLRVALITSEMTLH